MVRVGVGLGFISPIIEAFARERVSFRHRHRPEPKPVMTVPLPPGIGDISRTGQRGAVTGDLRKNSGQGE